MQWQLKCNIVASTAFLPLLSDFETKPGIEESIYKLLPPFVIKLKNRF